MNSQLTPAAPVPTRQHWRADETLLAVLHSALRRDDDATYLATLLDAGLVVPTDRNGENWALAQTDSGTMVVVFSSVEAMHASPVGDAMTYVVRPVIDLVHAWPDRKWSLLIDGTLDTQVLIDSEAVAELAERAAEMYPLDAAIRAADGHPRTYLRALLSADVIVPMRPKGSPARDLASPGFAWWHIGDSGNVPSVALFTSPVRLQVSLGDVPWLAAPFKTVLAHWPDGCAAVIDPEHHLGMSLPAEAMAGMAVLSGQGFQ
jgi:hypothetical protein